MGVETFEHMFLMREKDLEENPPPNFFWLGRRKLKVRYRGQVQTCWKCNAEDHKAFECPRQRQTRFNKEDPPLPCAVCHEIGHKAAQCSLYQKQDVTLLKDKFN